MSGVKMQHCWEQDVMVNIINTAAPHFINPLIMVYLPE